METALNGACVGECLRALRSHSVASPVLYVALTALSNLTNGCPANKVAVHKQGGIPLLLAVLTAASPSAKVLESAARILSNMASDQPAIRAAAGADSAPAVLVAALRKYGVQWRDAATQLCAALAHMCPDSSCAKAACAAGMMPALVMVMRAHGSACPKLARFSCAAVHMACDAGPSIRVLARDAGAIVHAITALRKHMADPMAAYAAVSALSALAD
jgi:hypothetical protein